MTKIITVVATVMVATVMVATVMANEAKFIKAEIKAEEVIMAMAVG